MAFRLCLILLGFFIIIIVIIIIILPENRRVCVRATISKKKKQNSRTHTYRTLSRVWFCSRCYRANERREKNTTLLCYAETAIIIL